VVCEESCDALAAAFASVATDSPRWLGLGANAQRRARARFAIPLYAERCERLYQRAV
jgi:hypothetical protein